MCGVAVATPRVGADLAGALAGGRHYRHYFLPLTSSEEEEIATRSGRA